MTVDERLADQARAAAELIAVRARELERARAGFQRSVHALHLGGASLREIAELLDLSHQRVHQLLDLPRGPRSRGTRTCSFCGREQSEVAKLILGPGRAGICTDCVGLAGRAVADGAAATDVRATIVARPGPCSFCGKRPGQVDAFASTEDGESVVCGECLSLCREILAEVT